MAHASYNCCLICDDKMEFNEWDNQTKEKPCTGCLMVMRDSGDIFLTPKELIKKLKSMSWTAQLHYLHTIGYAPCYYDNPTDKYLQKIKLVTTKAKDGAWGARLRKLPTPKQPNNKKGKT